MNFEIVTNNRFKIGIDFYRRTYQVKEKSNGLLQIFNTLNGKVLIDNIDFSMVTINNMPAINMQALQEVIYNISCICDPDLEDSDYEIFDESFDNTFE